MKKLNLWKNIVFLLFLIAYALIMVAMIGISSILWVIMFIGWLILPIFEPKPRGICE